MKLSTGRRIRHLLAVAVLATGLAALGPTGGAPPAGAQATGCPSVGSNFAGTGPFAVATQSDTDHTFYFPSSLGSQGCTRHPVILWGNGTFTTPSVYDGLLRHWASHGFIVAAANTSNAGTGQEMLAGLGKLTQYNGQSGNRFYQRVDVERVGTTGHSQGGAGAARSGTDPRIDTVFPIEGGFFSTSGQGIRVPTLFLAGEADTLKTGIKAAYDAATQPSAYAELRGAGHLVPLGNGGGFRGASTAWARWQLMGDTTAQGQFVGANCGLCNSPDWVVYESKGLGGGSQPPGGGQCVTATNSQHVQAGRATSFLVFVFAAGSGQYLGTTTATTSLRQASAGRWEMVQSC